MSYYCKKRRKAGLSRSEVSNALGIDYNRYVLIEKGEVKMPKKLINKFNEIINKTKGENDINRKNREQIVNEWWDEMCEKQSHGKYKINDKLEEFNISSLSELSNLLGYKHRGTASDYLNRTREVSFDIKDRFYSFFENELNIQPPKKMNKKTNEKYKVNMKRNNNLSDWYSSFDVDEWCEKNNISRQDIIKNTHLSSGTISNLFNGKTIPADKTLSSLKKYVNEIEKAKQVTMEFTSIPVEEVPEEIQTIGKDLAMEVNEDMKLKEKLINKYGAKLEEIENNINKYKHLIEKLECEKVFYEEILKDINED